MALDELDTSARRAVGRPRDATREHAILETTLDILSEAGFSGLTVDAIVTRAKVSKATIYRRWATKEELAIAAFDLLPALESPDTGSLEADLQAYVAQYSLFLKTTALRTVLPALVSDSMHNPALAEQLRAFIASRKTSGVKMIERAVARGGLPTGTDADLAHELIVGPMMQRSFFDPDNLNPRDFQIFAKIIIAGLRNYWATEEKR